MTDRNISRLGGRSGEVSGWDPINGVGPIGGSDSGNTGNGHRGSGQYGAVVQSHDSTQAARPADRDRECRWPMTACGIAHIHGERDDRVVGTGGRYGDHERRLGLTYATDNHRRIGRRVIAYGHIGTGSD